VVGEVVDRQDDRRPTDHRVVGVPAVAEQRDRAGVPVVDVDQVDRPLAPRGVGPERLERGPAEQPEPPGVVGEVAAARRTVEAVAVEGGRVVDEPEAVAVRRDVDDRDVDRAGERDAGRGHGRSSSRPLPRNRHGAVAREEDVDKPVGRARDVRAPGRARRPRRPGAGLRPRLALGRDERDAEGWGIDSW
jgi:hypothetical protein